MMYHESMGTKVMTGIIIVLAIIIVVLAWLLWVVPASAPSVPLSQQTATSTTPKPKPTSTTTAPAPLHDKVSVTSPAPHSTVGHTITVLGSAPGQWYFEAQFPIKVRDENDNVIGSAPASAQGDWMTTSLVPFKALISIDSKFHGNATIILLKDNPSGLPQNDDSLEIPVVVQ